MHRRSTCSSLFLLLVRISSALKLIWLKIRGRKKNSCCARDRCNWILRNSMSVITYHYCTYTILGPHRSSQWRRFDHEWIAFQFVIIVVSSIRGARKKIDYEHNQCSGSVPCALEQVCRCNESSCELRDARSSANWNMEKLFNELYIYIEKWKKSHTQFIEYNFSRVPVNIVWVAFLRYYFFVYFAFVSCRSLSDTVHFYWIDKLRSIAHTHSGTMCSTQLTFYCKLIITNWLSCTAFSMVVNKGSVEIIIKS